jgi:hypothetical protein
MKLISPARIGRHEGARARGRSSPAAGPCRHHDPARRIRRSGRRGTALVFVLGVLTLVALVGLILIARTHGEARRVSNLATASSNEALLDGVIHTIRETLRRDIWGSNPAAAAPLGNTFGGLLTERNEPFDAPGADQATNEGDRWLASSTPYSSGRRQAWITPTGQQFEEDVPAWRYVSYLGSDLLADDHLNSGTRPFAWFGDSRTVGPPPAPRFFTRAALDNVPILQTPPPAFAGPLIPGSTTNVSIAAARRNWMANHLPQLNAHPLLLGKRAQFPWFDTNADGIVDLYDADGDGVPDSPLSFPVAMDSVDPDAPRQLYAAIRVVDHAGMLNVNAASSLRTSANALLFDESGPDGQRRGRRATELLLDELVHSGDLANGGPSAYDRVFGLVQYRWNDASPPDPRAYDADVLRRLLLGGALPGADYFTYGLTEEASLRHRGLLAPHDRRTQCASPLGEYDTIDKALRHTLLWSREVSAAGAYLWPAGRSRWNRLNSNYQPFDPAVPTTYYEGYPNAGGLGWREMLREDEPFALRRHMFTTVSHEVALPPDIVTATGTAGVDDALADLRSRGMDWPVLTPTGAPAPPFNTPYTRNPVAAGQLPPDWARVQPIDLNMSDPANAAETRDAFIRYCAAAIYLGLRGVPTYQGIPVQAPPNGLFNREYLAWQFAANIADFRDADDEPTAIEWPAPGRNILFGLEKQPFFTEVYAYLTAGSNPNVPSPAATPDRWFHAVELFIPPYWKVPIDHLYIGARSAGSAPTGLRHLTTFLNQGGFAPPNPLDGGPAGRYIVLCGSTSHAPGDLAASIPAFYRNSGFEIDDDGKGRVELWYAPDLLPTGAPGPLTHVIDAIDPDATGRPLAPSIPTEEWAAHPPGVPVDSRHEFSMLRSTNGWRFTIGWQDYKYRRIPGLIGVELQRSLGASNEAGFASPLTAQLDFAIPPSIWPGLAHTGNSPLPDGFASDQPYNSFDSAAEISRIPLIGHVRRPAAPADPPFLSGIGISDDETDIPATVLLARLMAQVNPGSNLTEALRMACGRIDFANAPTAGGRPWTARLSGYFTTQNHLHDKVDNDGDGLTDLLVNAADPTEGLSALYRLAGRININTAPIPVLRAVPFLNLLPTSPEYLFHTYGAAVPPNYSPYDEYLARPGQFWDFASAIVARRETRDVDLRLLNPAFVPPTGVNSRLQTVATAHKPAAGGPGPAGGPSASSSAFRSVADLAGLNQVTDLAGNNAAFRVDRFTAETSIAGDPALALGGHKVLPADPTLGRADPFAPDFRARRIAPNEWTVDYAPVLPAGAAERAGLRARDIFLARWANLLTTRSDVFTAYIALIDEQGRTVQRSQVTLDRSDCFRETPPAPGQQRSIILPRILTRTDGGYADDTR